MFRLVRGIVVEGLGMGGLLWVATLMIGSETRKYVPLPADEPPQETVAAPFRQPLLRESLAQTPAFQAPLVYREALTPPAETVAEATLPPTFFRGGNSLFDR